MSQLLRLRALCLLRRYFFELKQFGTDANGAAKREFALIKQYLDIDIDYTCFEIEIDQLMFNSILGDLLWKIEETLDENKIPELIDALTFR